MNKRIKALSLTLCVFFLLQMKSSYAQKEFAFNTPGNTCYLIYTCYAPNGEYSIKKRPYIFILGKSGESAQETFEKDSLKRRTEFSNYLLVYLPNKAGSATTKLGCLEAVSSLVTNGFSLGHLNVFFQVNDETISRKDIESLEINKLFKSIRLCSEITKASPSSISEDFKQTEIKVEVPVVEEEGGTYYIEEDKTPDIVTDNQIVAQKKEYFGKPQSFNFVLSGVIRDKSTGEALPFAGISIKSNGVSALSNTDGYFTLSNVPTDTNTLVVHYIGYDNTSIYLTPQSSKKNLVIELRPTSTTLKALTVSANREDVVLISKDEVGLIKMTPKKLEQLPNLGERDIMRSFQLMPGVSASNESSSGLYVRGGTPDQNLVLYDGFTVYHVDHLYGFYSAFNTNALKDMQLYKGGFESRFGGRLSSVTEITGKDGNQKKFNIGGDLSLLSMNLYTEIPIGEKFSSIITFRRSYQGYLYDLIFKKFNQSTATTDMGGGRRFSQNTNVVSYFYDLNGKFTYKPTDKDIVSLSIYNGTDKLDNGSASQMPSFGGTSSNFSMSSTDLTKYGNIGTSLKWSRRWTPKLYGNTILSYSNYYSDRDRTQERTTTNSSGESVTNKNGILENNNLKDYSLKSDYQWDIANHCQLQFGGFGTKFDIKYTYAQNDTTTILDKQNNSFLVGTYLQSKFKFLKDKIQFTPGFRTTYFDATGKVYYEPRASLSINITDKLSIKGATGKYYQFANRVTREDILSGSKDFWLLSDDKSIPVSSSIHYITGLSYETNNYLFSAEGYYKQISNLTEYSLRINASPMGVNYNENFLNGYGYAKGIEFLMQKKSGNINGWLSYTLGEAKNHFTAYSDSYYPADQDVTNEFKAVLLYKVKRWDFSATWIYATGRPYTAPSGAYTITLLDGSTKDYFTVTDKNGLRLPDYHRADFSVTYKLLQGKKGVKKRRELGYVGLSFFNIYNRKNVWYKQYTIVSGQIIETNVNYLGFVPNIVLSLKLR